MTTSLEAVVCCVEFGEEGVGICVELEYEGVGFCLLFERVDAVAGGVVAVRFTCRGLGVMAG